MIKKHPIFSMATAHKIIRTSIYTFLKHYQHLTSTPSTLALPFALSIFISQATVPRSWALFPATYNQGHSLFEAASFPQSSTFFNFITLKLSQAISSFIVTFPFAISFLLLAKAIVISSLFKRQSSFISLYNPLLITYICNSLVIFSINATFFSLLFLAITFLESFLNTFPKWVLLFSFIAFVCYSIVLANTLVICNLALVSSAMDEEGSNKGGFIAILRSCAMIRGKTAIALALALPINLGFASVESLFHYRIINHRWLSFHAKNWQLWLVGFEGVFIAYLYSMLLLLEVILSCFFYQSCRTNNFCYDVDVDDDDKMKLKGLKEVV